jgi:hypothetical protein
LYFPAIFYTFVAKPISMRKSREVPLTLLAIVALSITACRDEPQNCVDAQNHLLPSGACQSGSTVSRGGFGGFGSSGSGGGDE